MERWQNKVVVVTGASAGIGAVIAADLVKNGFIVVALARREERLQENHRALPENLQSRYYPRTCDVTNEDQVKDTFAWIETKFGGTDVLVNNAGMGVVGVELSAANNTEPIRNILETNIMGVVYCVREAFNSMKNRNFDGHVVIINSITGHYVPIVPFGPLNMYPPSKFAVTAMVETYRQEFANAGTKVKVTSISPGFVLTEIMPKMEAFRAAGNPLLNAEDVSNAVLYVLSTPPHVQVHELTIRPVGEKM
ncbi:farnesol dehydrogenase-like [Hermetia illucens]|uniref:farnesol dehydrogenase-like n=1 Tax=Hermetia illucens TaxID=343691 RepID=UPI0018CC1E4F|nr:farnesol dehydrogenase-like [Hermetia illucens]